MWYFDMDSCPSKFLRINSMLLLRVTANHEVAVQGPSNQVK